MSSIITAGFVRPMEKGIILHLAGESEASFEAPVAHTLVRQFLFVRRQRIWRFLRW
ncbi:hypothetical protein [Enterobacter soli]|uniref:hypothetical protein n=1 Tax=Enterobacter TaxID=547 RepID=UPI002148F9FD|nr:hypothetical protein [Enterobacter soli]MCR1317439.1 hypothetical protein [Enterobacter soli]